MKEGRNRLKNEKACMPQAVENLYRNDWKALYISQQLLFS